MPQKALRPCSKVGCTSLTRDRYCSQHKNILQKDKAEHNKYYDKNTRDKKSKDFYNSPEWERAREQALIRDKGLCQHCLRKGKTTLADMVHHKTPIKINWLLRLVLSNLISLCNSCHSKEYH